MSWHSDGMALRLLLASAAQSRALFSWTRLAEVRSPLGHLADGVDPLPAVYLPNLPVHVAVSNLAILPCAGADTFCFSMRNVRLLLLRLRRFCASN